MVWQLRQNSSLLVASIVVFSVCQAMIPATNPPVTSTPKPMRAEGRINWPTRRHSKTQMFFMINLPICYAEGGPKKKICMNQTTKP